MTGTTKNEIVQAISEVIPELTHKEIEKMIRPSKLSGASYSVHLGEVSAKLNIDPYILHKKIMTKVKKNKIIGERIR